MKKGIGNLAGHGPGPAHNRGSLIGNEGDNNLGFARVLDKELELNYDVVSKVDRDVFGNYAIPVDRRGKWASDFDIMLDHHTNAAGPKATGTLIVLSYQSLKYYDIAKRLAQLIASTLGTVNRGVVFKNYHTGKFHGVSTASTTKTNWFGTLRNSKAPFSVLIEYVFHTNKGDLEKFLNNQDKLAKAIAAFLSKEFGINKKQTVHKDYVIRVNSRINIRKGPAVSYAIVQKLYSGAYTIIDTKGSWGKLKSGLGWIWLGNVEKVR